MTDTDIPEEWRVVEDFPSYAVSNLGRVKRIVSAKTYSVTGKCLTPNVTVGYEHVTLCRDGRTKIFRVNKLVCTVFHGPTPGIDYQAAHNDGNKRNNRADNLRWATPTENQKDRIRHGTDSRGVKHYATTLTEREVLEIRLHPRSNGCLNVLAEKYGVSRNSINNIRGRISWQWLNDDGTHAD